MRQGAATWSRDPRRVSGSACVSVGYERPRQEAAMLHPRLRSPEAGDRWSGASAIARWTPDRGRNRLGVMKRQRRVPYEVRMILVIAGLAVLISLLSQTAPAVSGGSDGPPPIQLDAREKKAVKSITGKELLKYIVFLASDKLQGREAGTDAGHQAGDFLASEFERLGLKPGGENDTYFQPFSLTAQVSLATLQESNVIEVTHREKPKKTDDDRIFKFRFDFVPYPISASMMVDPSPVTFVGFGISEKEKGYDDYRRAKVKGRVAVALDHVPMEGKAGGPFHGEEETYSDPLYKAKIAEKEGAVALIIIKDILNHPGEMDVPKDLRKKWPPEDAPESVGIPVVFACYEMGRFVLGDKDPAKLQEKIEKTGKPLSVKISSRYVRLEIASFGRVKGAGRNVIGILEGADETLKEEVIVIGAHYDHVGLGRFGTRGGAGQVHNGANDNASGTSGVLELAEAFAENKIPVRRSIVFIGFDGEEKGLLGSRYYVTQPAVPMDRTVAMINLDMIGVNKDFQLYVGGGKDNAALESIHLAANKIVGLSLLYEGMESLRYRSDQAPFVEAGVPALFLYTGGHPEYHTPRDDPPLINRKLIEGVSRLAFIISLEVANRDPRP